MHKGHLSTPSRSPPPHCFSIHRGSAHFALLTSMHQSLLPFAYSPCPNYTLSVAKTRRGMQTPSPPPLFDNDSQLEKQL